MRPRALVLASALVALVACRHGASTTAPDAGPGDAATTASTASGADAAGAVTVADAGPTKAWPVWTAKLATEEDFLHYSREVGGDRFTKLVIDLRTKATYYADAELYPMHKDFVFGELWKKPRTKEAERELDRNYGKDKPDFLFCYVVHHLAADAWTLAFWDGDLASPAHVRLAFERLRASFYAAPKVKFRPISNAQEKVAAEVPEIPSITQAALYASTPYHAFHRGHAVGKLRIVRDADTTFAPDEIVILPEPLTDITPVAGIVSATASTPLAHVNLRAAAWDVPNVSLLGAVARFGALAGQTVWFEAGESDATIRPATEAEIAAARAARTRPPVQVPRADLARTAFAPLATLKAADAVAYGSKTANLGAIAGANVGIAVPRGFGIPVAAYAEHLRAAGLDAEIARTIADPKFRASAETRKTELARLRAAIVAAPLSPTTRARLAAAHAELLGDAGGAGVFVRSSTNAEDLAGFSGAGLYDTVPNVRGLDAVGDAVKRVWASVWNLAAYEERELYGIDHTKVLGAVLVQLGVDATAAGVLVTAHPSDPKDKQTVTINAKSGLGIRVVDGKKVPEIVVYNTFNHALRVVSRSDEDTVLSFAPDGGVREVPNPQRGAPVLTDARVKRLAEAAQKIRGVFPGDQPLDIEWLYAGDTLWIVQARPYMGGVR